MKLKNFMDFLKFKCPGCGQCHTYGQLLVHIKDCEGIKKIKKEGRPAIDTNKQSQSFVPPTDDRDRRFSQQQKFGVGGSAQISQSTMIANLPMEFPSELYVFQKDSRTVSIYDVKNKSCVHKFVDFKGNFPHNFQMIQVGIH